MLIINYYKINIKLIGTEIFNEKYKSNDLNKEKKGQAAIITYFDKYKLDFYETKQFKD